PDKCPRRSRKATDPAASENNLPPRLRGSVRDSPPCLRASPSRQVASFESLRIGSCLELARTTIRVAPHASQAWLRSTRSDVLACRESYDERSTSVGLSTRNRSGVGTRSPGGSCFARALLQSVPGRAEGKRARRNRG